MTSDRRRVLFLCTHNSARSQIAEGLLRAWGGARFEVASAGTDPRPVRPEAIEVMRELGIDIGGHRSEPVTAYVGESWDRVVTVCDDAREACPVFPGAAGYLHWNFEDPSLAQGDPEQRMAVYRRVAAEIAAHVRRFIDAADEGRDERPRVQ